MKCTRDFDTPPNPTQSIADMDKLLKALPTMTYIPEEDRAALAGLIRLWRRDMKYLQVVKP